MFKYNKIFKNQIGLLQRSLSRPNKIKSNQIKQNNNNNNKINKNNNNIPNNSIKNNNYNLMNIIDNSEAPVVIEIQPSWDLPIKRYNQQLEDIIKSRTNGNITLVKLDIDRDYDIVKKFKVLEFPTILGLSRGNINIQLKGKNLSSNEINEFINKLEDSHYK